MQLQKKHFSLFGIFRDHCLLLTRAQIQRVLTLPKSTTTRQLSFLVSNQYLERRYRKDTFTHFQAPLYYLGSAGWQAAGKSLSEYKKYRLEVEERAERDLEHTLGIYDVYLKLLLESEVKRIIDSSDRVWQEALDFGNIPDAWIQFKAGEAFIEVDRGTEHPIVVKRKLEKYVRFKQSGQYKQLFPNCAFNVLVFTTTEERIESLERVTPTDDIWFCTLAEFIKKPLDHQHWFALHGFYALPTATKKEV